MVLFLMALLYISIAGMGMLIAVKYWELQTGTIIGARVRPAIMQALHSLVYWSRDIFPLFLREYSVRIEKMVRTVARHALASAILWTEHTLERALHALRHKTAPPPHQEGSASEFLREVTEHKKMLTRRRRTPSAKK